MSIWRPHTTAILIGGVILVIVASAIAFMLSNLQPKTEVRVGTAVFQTQLADDEAERTKGLSGVSSLGANDGLLMVFPSDDTWGIWMRDMKVPIDIIWIDRAYKVVHIVKNAQPEDSTAKTFAPMKPARFVLEVPAGSVEMYGIKVGDMADFAVALNEVQ